MKKININIPGNQYNVYLGKGIFNSLPSLLNKYELNKNIFLIVDKKVYECYRPKFSKFYNGVKTKKHLFVFEASEKNKTINSVNSIFSELLNNNFSRDTLIIAVGGGITGDLAGFAASAFARGVQFVQIPTTLLAMVDSSVGGKTGVNFGKTKNIIGAFYQPKFVLVDPDFLNTLPEDEILCGIGEIVKTGFLTGGDFHSKVSSGIDKMIKLDNEFLSNVIETCVKFKAGVVENDEKEEKGIRKILNLGHTFAHAIEIELNHKIKHGQAVIVGLVCAFYLSQKIGFMNDNILSEYLDTLKTLTGSIQVGKLNINRMYDIMQRDKKNKNEIIKFVLISEAGKIFVDTEAAKSDIIYAMDMGIQFFKS